MAEPVPLHRSLTFRYVLALTLVGTLATAAFLSLHKVILRHENEAAVVNLSGRQRMLSQRITLSASHAALTGDTAVRRQWLDELAAALDLMERSHLALTHGDPALGIPADLAGSIGVLYAEEPAAVSRQVAEFLADGRAVLAAADRLGPQDPAYRRLLVRSPVLLSGLDEVVRRYQLEVEDRVRVLERLETAVWLVTLMVLALEAALIFRPMVRRVQALLRAEEQRREAAERQSINDQRSTEALIDTIADGVVIVDQDGIIRTFSPSAERMFGWSRAEAVGQGIGLLMPDPYRESYPEILRQQLDGRLARPIGVGQQVVGQRRDGSLFPLEMALGEWTDGQRRYLTAVMRDITQRQALEDSVRRAQKMEAVGQLSGGVAHDFNNLLGVIAGNLEIIEDRLADDPRMLKRVRVAQRATTRGADLTRKLLSFSGGRASRPETVDLNGLVESSRDLLDRLQTSRVAVVLVLSAQPLPVWIDPGEFEDALLNLALNARDAMPAGGTLSIRTECLAAEDVASESGGQAVISVTDTGSGIPPELQKRIFEPFFSSKPPGKGTGLGLVTVEGFVKRAGGAIRVYSEPDRGTTFRIALPLAADGPAAAPAPDSAPLPGGDETVLVVDDESDLRELVCSQLEGLGYRCLAAPGPAQALALLEAEPAVALLVTDIIMPGPLDGIELARRALAGRPDLKVLLSTGFAGRSEADLRQLVAGAGVIGKPYRRRELAAKVRALLDG